jgi:hypothetical protein
MAIGDMISHAKQKIITNGEGYLLGHSETPLQLILVLYNAYSYFKKYIYSESYEIAFNSYSTKGDQIVRPIYRLHGGNRCVSP